MKKFIILMSMMLGLCSVVVFQNCSKSKSGSASGTSVDDLDVDGSGRILKSVRYYQGGGFPGPNGPNQTDFTVEIQHSQYATITVEGDEGDCDRMKVITATQISSIVNLLNTMQYRVKPPSDVYRVDGGETFIELRYRDSSEVLKLYIDAAEAEVGVFEIVRNQAEINDLLLDLYEGNGYVESCYAINFDQTPVIRFFRGGWYGLPNTPNWSHDYVLDLNTRVLKSKVNTPNCSKSRTLSQNDVAGIKAIISSGNISKKQPSEPQMADGAYEYIEFYESSAQVSSSGAKQIPVVHLIRDMAGIGDLAFDGSTVTISTALKSLVDNQSFGNQTCP
ncbi:MAG: hypothetical protein K2Q26_07060 [Bdellovibrionales bacterium]|nr:hypothetical protein [Bdellovibrionales bacterium]